MKTKEDERAIRYAQEHLDLSKNLNDQGYYGPMPNEADPRANYRGSRHPANVEYYKWVERWCAAHNYVFDNEQMDRDRWEYLMQKRKESGDTGPIYIEQ